MPPKSSSYANTLSQLLSSYDWTKIDTLADQLFEVWRQKRTVFLCGNGGSAANATHLANDFLYGSNPTSPGIRVQSLSDNASILTCLGNDIGYENIFAHQLKTQASQGDLLIVFSGSGNSPNILQAIETAKNLGLTTAAILGFDGGQCKTQVDHPIHFQIDDMQIAEDVQQTIGHMLTRRVQHLISNAKKRT